MIRPPPLFMPLCALSVGLVCLLVLVAVPAQTPGMAATKAIPVLTGKSCDEALGLLRKYGLVLSSCKPGEPTGRVAEGLVNGQVPVAGTPLSQTQGVVTATTEPAPPQLPSKPVRVPPLVDQTAPQARSTLDMVGLQASVAPGENDNSHFVLRGNPPSGALVPRGSTVHLITQVRVRMPEIAGRSAADARALIEKSGLQGVFEGLEAEEGVVAFDSRPSGGTLVAVGTVVQVSMQLTVPDLRNLSCEEARARAQHFGFAELQCQRRHQPGAAPDRVFSQQPAPNTRLEAPAALQVELPPALVSVPDLHDRSPEDGCALLAEQRLQARFESADAAQPGRVVDAQRPAAGEHVDEGTQVWLHTMALIPVPDVSGLSCAAMRAESIRVGLQPSCSIFSLPMGLGEPRVVTQRPAPGTLVKPGTAFVATLRTSIPWGWVGGLLAAILAGLAWVCWPPPRPYPGISPAALAVGLRAHPDPAPELQLRWAGAALQLPALALRTELGASELSVVGLSTLGVNDGQH